MASIPMVSAGGSDGLSNAPTVLAIDDEPGLLRLIRLELTSAGMVLLPAESGAVGLAILASQDIDIVVLDIVMPERSGIDVLGEIKQRWAAMPVVILTADNRAATLAQAVEAGADDVITKPFSPEDLTSRIHYLLGIASDEVEAEQPVRIGDVQIELRRQRVTRDGEPVTLSRTEWMLLRRLVEADGEASLDQELLAKIWGREYRTDVEYLRLWIERLRRKLGDDPAAPRLIRRFQDVGYRFAASDTPIRSD